MSKKITTTVYITEEQNQLLKELHKRTRVPVAEYMREGIDMVLEKYAENLPGQLELGEKSGAQRPRSQLARKA
jgi:predicted DNA-binding protein